MKESYIPTESEKFFINKISETAKSERIVFNINKLNLLLIPIMELPTSGLDRATSIDLNNDVIQILKVALKKDLANTPKNEIKYIKTGIFRKFAIPEDWYIHYFDVYNKSQIVLTGILQNLVIGNPFENQ
jgi:hypothetical protein